MSVRIRLPIFLAIAFFRASDTIGGMGRGSVRTLPEPSRFGRRGFGGRLPLGTPQAGRVLPYDFNEATGVDGPGGRRGFGGYAADPTLDPLVGLEDVSKPLRSKLLAVPALRAKYLALVRDIADRWLDWNKIAPLVVECQALIDAEVRLDGRKWYGYDRFTPAPLQAFFERRRAFLLQ